MKTTLIVAFAVATVANAATIKGKVTLSASAPKQKEIKMSADPGCVKANAGKTVMSDKEVVGAGGAVQWAYVYIKSGAQASKAPTTPIVLDQNGCMYRPHVIAVQAGQPIKILNSDSLLHNVHSLAKGAKNKKDNFNAGMAVKGQEMTKSFSAAEFPPIKVKCDVHGWMTSYIGVSDHPYTAVTNEKGEFTIGNVPPGDYVVEVWHESFKTSESPVKVGADAETKEVNFTYTKS